MRVIVCSEPPEVSNLGRLLVLGTLKLDVITGISAANMAVEHDVYERAEVRLEVGGTAAGVVRAAALGSDWTAHILAAVGDDALTPAIENFIERMNATSSLQRCDGTPNAGVVLVGVGNGSTIRRRLLLSSAQSPHLLLSPQHVRQQETRFAQADVFLADCYSLQAPLSTSALDTALELARAHGLYTILDLVPHDLPRTINRHLAGGKGESWPAHIQRRDIR
jgi:sugar/nucleoside kinase (ribokinase family)